MPRQVAKTKNSRAGETPARTSRARSAVARSNRAGTRPRDSHAFARAIIAWQQVSGRHGLPWQARRTAYRVWLSEVMLQQTQVGTVIPYFERFVSEFPTVTDLADADQDDVMALWSGLGYYSRARNLHRCAQIVRDQYNGEFPQTLQALCELPGIGRSTAAAISVFAHGQREAILDGNVKRVFCRQFVISGAPAASSTLRTLWACAEQQLPQTDLVPYTQGLMDLGATVCTRTRPQCEQCPVGESCQARVQNTIDQLPNKAARRKVPQRRVTMLVLTRDRAQQTEVWLQRRPDTGIWGGLFSLPESSLPADATAHAHFAQAGLLSSNSVANLARDSVASVASDAPDLTDARLLDTINHVFTHFQLQIEPVLVRLDKAATAPGLQPDGGGQWYALHDAAQAGLPAPVKKLLANLAAQLQDPATS